MKRLRGVGVDIDVPELEAEAAGFYTARCCNHRRLASSSSFSSSLARDSGTDWEETMASSPDSSVSVVDCFIPVGMKDRDVDER